MGRGVLEVIKPGLATSVQDLGRTGYQQYGVVVSGAMDAYALQVGNLLVGISPRRRWIGNHVNGAGTGNPSRYDDRHLRC